MAQKMFNAFAKKHGVFNARSMYIALTQDHATAKALTSNFLA
jgi:hypothetical protein